MAATAVLMLALTAQGTEILEVGKPIVGTIGANSPVAHTPTLDVGYTNAPTVGNEFQVLVAKSGPYAIELRSYDFDAYLVISDGEGALLAEDDDGLISSHARVVLNLDANHSYVVQACALHGKRGKFLLQLLAGAPVPTSLKERKLANEADRKAGLAHIEQTLGKETAEYAESQNRLGLFYLNQNEYKKAQEELESAFAIWEKVLGPKHPSTVSCLDNLATLLQTQGNYDEARPLYERALAITEEVLGPEHLDTANSLNNLAFLLKSQGHFEEARPMLERALEIREKVLGEDHTSTATSLTNLALLLEDQGNYDEARTLYERALAIDEKVLGPEHPNTAQSLNNLAALLSFQGHYEEARPLYERALAIKEKVFGPEHLSIAKGLNNLATLLQTQGLYDEARRLHERALAIKEKILGPEHPAISASLNNMAAMLYTQGKYEEARPLFERALEISEKVFGPEHPDTVQSLNNLAAVLFLLKLDEEALPLFLRSFSGALAKLDRELPSMSEAGRLQFLESSANPENFLRFLSQITPASLIESCSRFQNWKGKATRLQAASVKLSQSNETPGLGQKKQQIQEIAQELSGLILVPLAEQADGHAKRIDSLRKERLRLERELNRELGLDLVLATPSLKEVQAGLASDAVLLDFFAGEDVYAWVLKSTGEPVLFFRSPAVLVGR